MRLGISAVGFGIPSIQPPMVLSATKPVARAIPGPILLKDRPMADDEVAVLLTQRRPAVHVVAHTMLVDYGANARGSSTPSSRASIGTR